MHGLHKPVFPFRPKLRLKRTKHCNRSKSVCPCCFTESKTGPWAEKALLGRLESRPQYPLEEMPFCCVSYKHGLPTMETGSKRLLRRRCLHCTWWHYGLPKRALAECEGGTFVWWLGGRGGLGRTLWFVVTCGTFLEATFFLFIWTNWQKVRQGVSPFHIMEWRDGVCRQSQWMNPQTALSRWNPGGLVLLYWESHPANIIL